MDPLSLKALNARAPRPPRRDPARPILTSGTRPHRPRGRSRSPASSATAVAKAFRTGNLGGRRGRRRSYFLNVHLPQPRLVVIGAVHISQALAPMARIAGYRRWRSSTRAPPSPRRTAFPMCRCIAEWPEDVLKQRPLDAYTALAAVTHDPKIDDFALKAALDAGCFYVGALGSRKTHAKRVERLLALGATPSRSSASMRRSASTSAPPARRRSPSPCWPRSSSAFRSRGSASRGKAKRHEIRAGPGRRSRRRDARARHRRRRAALPQGASADARRHRRAARRPASRGHRGVLDAGDLDEDDAATRLAERMRFGGVEAKPAATGRVNLHARAAGVFTVDKALIDAINAVDPAITLATRRRICAGRSRPDGRDGEDHSLRGAGAWSSAVERSLAAARAFAVNPFRPMRVGLIQTVLPGLKDSVLDQDGRRSPRRGWRAPAAAIVRRTAHAARGRRGRRSAIAALAARQRHGRSSSAPRRCAIPTTSSRRRSGGRRRGDPRRHAGRSGQSAGARRRSAASR